MDGFDPLRVGHAEYRDLGDLRVRRDHVLHLRAVHVVATGDDHVLQPSRM
jgi:hypothetical protein